MIDHQDTQRDKALMADLWGESFDALCRRVQEARIPRNHELRRRLAALRRKRRALERRLREAAHGVKSDWEDVRDDLEEAMKDFHALQLDVGERLVHERRRVIEKEEADAMRWSRYVDSLLRAFHDRDRPHRRLAPKLEALRNQRDSMVTKVHALKRHERSGWRRARREVEEAQSSLRRSWSTVIATIDREGPNGSS